MTVLLVVLGGALGAPARYLVDRWVQGRRDGVFPWGTLTVNVIGSFLFGSVMSLAAAGAVSEGVSVALGTGFCGALTTFSTFGYETLRLVSDGSGRYAALNVFANVAAGLAAAGLGLLVGGAVAG